MKTWTQLAVGLAVGAGLLVLTYAYSARLAGELLAQLEIAELEAIPVLGEQG